MKNRKLYFLLAFLLSGMLFLMAGCQKKAGDDIAKETFDVVDFNELEDLAKADLYTYEEMISLLEDGGLSDLSRSSLEDLKTGPSYEDLYFKICQAEGDLGDDSALDLEASPQYVLGFSLDEEERISGLGFAGPFDVLIKDKKGKVYGFDGNVDIHLVSDLEMNSLIHGYGVDENGDQVRNYYFQRDLYLAWLSKNN